MQLAPGKLCEQEGSGGNTAICSFPNFCKFLAPSNSAAGKAIRQPSPPPAGPARYVKTAVGCSSHAPDASNLAPPTAERPSAVS